MNMKALRNLLIASTILLALAGCKTDFQNLTPERITQNPSGIYTFSFKADINTKNWVRGSERAKIVINEKTFDMQKSPDSELTFTFDYKLPGGINEARYYYILEYEYSNNGAERTATKYSVTEEGKLYQSRLINRYAIQLISDRGPVGARIGLVGNGFTQQDSVVVGNQMATTEVFSANALEFVVPALPAGQNYDIFLQTGSGDLRIGQFRVDSGVLRVQPNLLNLLSGDLDFLIIEIDAEAPLGGLPVSVQTDIPASIIMPEVIIPEGSRSVNVNIEAGQPGSGILVISAPGYDEVTVPLTVD